MSTLGKGGYDMGKVNSNNDTGDTAKKLKHADAVIMQAESLIKQMEVEVRGQRDASVKKKNLQEKVNGYKNNLKSLKVDHTRAVQEAERQNLLGGEMIGSRSASQRQRLLDSNSNVERQNDSISNARRVAMETEQTASEITEELARNREKIGSIHGKVKDVSGLTGQARKIIQNINLVLILIITFVEAN